MPDVMMKFLVVEVDGEAAQVFPIVSLPDGGRFEQIEAILASNPILRLVDAVEAGQHWDGTQYIPPTE